MCNVMPGVESCGDKQLNQLSVQEQLQSICDFGVLAPKFQAIYPSLPSCLEMHVWYAIGTISLGIKP